MYLACPRYSEAVIGVEGLRDQMIPLFRKFREFSLFQRDSRKISEIPVLSATGNPVAITNAMRGRT